MPALDGELAHADELGIELRAGGGERFGGAGDALTRHVEVRRLLGLGAEHADAAVTEGEEVVDGDAADGRVVDAHGRERAGLLADGDHAEPAGGEIGDVVGFEGDLDEDQPVDAAVEGGGGVDGLARG